MNWVCPPPLYTRVNGFDSEKKETTFDPAMTERLQKITEVIEDHQEACTEFIEENEGREFVNICLPLLCSLYRHTTTLN